MSELDYAAIRVQVENLDRAFQDTGDATLLRQSVDLQRQLCAIESDSVVRRQLWISIGVDLSALYQHEGDEADLRESISIGRRLIDDDAAESWVTDRVNLSARLLLAWDTRSDQSALDEAVELLSESVQATGLDDEGRAALAANLANALGHRFDVTRSRVDLDAARRWYGVALAAAGENRSGLLSNLAQLLVDAYETGADDGALDEALSVVDETVSQPGPRLSQAIRWDTRARVLRARFFRDGAATDLRAAGESSQRALQLVPPAATPRAGMVALAASLAFERFVEFGERDGLEDAITWTTEALGSGTVADSHDVAALSNQLAMALTERFEIRGDSRDLAESVRLLEAALAAGLRTDMQLGLRTNLALALHQRWSISGRLRDLNAAIDHISWVLERTKPSVERAIHLNTLGLLLSARALKTKRPNDLDRAIDAGRDALSLTPRASPDRVIYLSNLASWLDDRYSRTAEPADLDESIAVLEDAFGAVADLSANRTRVAFTLAGRYERRYTDREPPDLGDLQHACDLWDETLAAGEPFIAVYAGQHLGEVAFAIGDWAKCEKALALSLDAARTLTANRHLSTDRERARLGVQGTAAMAALAASRDGRAEAAVTYLEQGTATLLAEASGLASETITIERARRATTILHGQLVYWAATPAGSLALVVSPDDDAIVAIPLPVTTAQVDVQLARLRASFDAEPDVAGSADLLKAWSHSVTELLAWTWNAFVEPVEQHISGDGRVGMVPIGRLAWLPLATARVPGRLALAQRCVPHLLPGAHFLRLAEQWPIRPAAYVAADPGPSGRYLPGVVPEATRVAALYGTEISQHRRRREPSGDPPAATRRLRRNHRPAPGPSRAGASSHPAVAALLDAFGTADVIHLACHFDLNPDDPLSSVLRLGKGYRLADLVDQRLDRGAHFVLSACESGLTGVTLPDEAIGAAPILLTAGARSVTASLWPIDDQLAPPFMVELHRRMSAGTDPARSLAETQRLMIDRGDPPVVWAAAAHYGA